MSFNLHLWFKNQYLKEEEFKKNVWFKLTDEEKDEFADEIFNLISTSYKDIGGHPNYKSDADVTGEEGTSDYMVIDFDDDDDLDAVKVTKNKPAGKKSVALGHDNSKEAKSKVVNISALMLKEPGHYVEVSGKLKDILTAKGVPIVTDKETIRKVLKGKEIKMYKDGTYSRSIGGEMHTKTLMGNPLTK